MHPTATVPRPHGRQAHHRVQQRNPTSRLVVLRGIAVGLAHASAVDWLTKLPPRVLQSAAATVLEH
jgi:hypothetical protein